MQAASKTSLALLFFDCVSAFYCLIRELLVDMQSSDEAVAWLLSSLNIPASAMHELAQLMRQTGELEQANVLPHLRAQLRDALSQTWFRVSSNPKVVRTHRGSRPGDVFGDVV